MHLKSIELSGFKSFPKKTTLEFASAITAIVGPNGSGKSNVAEAFRFVLGEQSMKSMRGKRGEDLIWNGSPTVSRAGRGSVKLFFDNRDRALNLDFDEVLVERVVHRSGENDYKLNGSPVRLRDIAGMLAHANIGASGHHIISQGEADRILATSSRERREMVEDALGLTAYLYKREDAERKLEKTAHNVGEVESLRRELGPHLKFLQSQVKKIEESETLRTELREKYLEYLKRESVYLSATHTVLTKGKEAPAREHEILNKKIGELRTTLEQKGKSDVGARDLVELEAQGRTVAIKHQRITRELGRIEGELAAHAKLKDEQGVVSVRDARDFGEKVLQLTESSKLAELMALARAFLQKIAQVLPLHAESDLEGKKKTLEQELLALQSEEERIGKTITSLRTSIESEKDASRKAERELFLGMAQRSALETALASLHARGELLAREKEAFTTELAEARALIGGAVGEYERHPLERAEEGRHKQEERHKKLERMKIKLEEMGTGNSPEVLKEYEEVRQRDAFLSSELGDLEASTQKLESLIEDLTATLQTRFEDGIEKINAEFDAFFKLMFGGGTASLSVVKERKVRRGVSEEEGEESTDEEEEFEEGIDINVHLPHKRIKGLHMLSGGERALTSIALIFAMSQVNPPPFLILDETDAALDEANSRRYGDMLENLSKKSQLVLITHNRETMSRAGVLYGITMGSDGVSKLLSVKFEEAVVVAK